MFVFGLVLSAVSAIMNTPIQDIFINIHFQKGYSEVGTALISELHWTLNCIEGCEETPAAITLLFPDKFTAFHLRYSKIIQNHCIIADRRHDYLWEKKTQSSFS